VYGSKILDLSEVIMQTQKHSKHTSWWQMYVIVLLMVGLLLLAHYLAPSPGLDKFLDIGILVLGYVVLDWWLRSNIS
jgi:hypothetical protein